MCMHSNEEESTDGSFRTICVSKSSETSSPNQKPADLPINSRFWSGMYNRFEKGLHPRQSVTDYLMAVKEETQQLEEELEVLGEVINT